MKRLYLLLALFIPLAVYGASVYTISQGGTNNGSAPSTNSLIYFDGTKYTSTSTQPLYIGSLVATSSATSTMVGGLSVAGGGFASSKGITISGGNLLLTSGATSTANNGFNLTAGCFSINGACISASGAAGTVTSVDIASSDSTLTVGGGPVTTTGTLTAVLNLASNNVWTAASTTFTGGVTINRATTTSATTTNFAFTGLASSLLSVNPTGQVIASSTIGNGQLQNSTISGISLGGTLGALTATDSTLTFSGSYNGSTARTIGLNLGNTNTWTATQTFANTVTTNATSTSLFASLLNVNGPLKVGTTTGTTTIWGNASSTFTGIIDSRGVSSSAGITVTGGEFQVNALTSALTLTGSDGRFAEYTGTTCTNQFVRVLSALGAATCATVGAADVSLANLTATDTTLTFSGTYNGSTARTIGLNLGNTNTWTALQTLTGGILVNNSTSTITNLVVVNATTTAATTTNLAFSGLTSSLLAVNPLGGVIASSTIGNAQLQNSTISGVSLGGTLGALTATDSTLTFSGSYTGATARTIGLNLANANTWTALQTLTGGILVNNATSTVTNLQVVNGTTTNATSTNLSVSGTVDFDTLTSALVLTGATGILAEYTGADCTNQFIRDLSALGAPTCDTIGAADVSLANLTATDSTLTFSGTYTGATARTIGLNLGNANTWTALQQFNAAASSSLLSSLNGVYVGTTATTSIFGDNATSTFNGGIASTGTGGGLATNHGLTITGGNILSTSAATSTFAQGINLTAGCFSINNVCVSGSGGSGTVTSVNIASADSTLTVGGGAITTAGTLTAILNLGNSNVWTAASTTFTNGVSIRNGTTTNATSTNLSVSETVDFDQLTSAIVLTGSTGILAEYAGTSCTNQFPRSLSALGAATCASVSLTADITGVLGIVNGGTNSAATPALNALMYYNGTGIVATSTSPLYVGALLATSTAATSTLNGGLLVDTNTLVVDYSRNIVSIGTTTSSALTLLQLFTTGTTTFSLDSNSATKGGCIEMKDRDGSGYTYVWVNNGQVFSSTNSCK